jgi:hypothetical protein
MERYANRSGNSGVRAYELRDDAIAVEFRSGDTYLYDYAKTGKGNVERMKRLAKSGSGLSAFISTHVRERYACRTSRGLRTYR